MDILALLRTAKEKAASDVHLVVSSPPLLRIDGSLQALDSATPLTSDEIDQAFTQMTTAEQRGDFNKNLELDFSYNLPDVGHLRGNAALQRLLCCAAMTKE